MAKIRALLYRQYKISRNSMLFQLIGSMLVILLALLAQLSMRCGNLQTLVTGDTDAELAVRIVLLIFLLTLSLVTAGSVQSCGDGILKSDVKTGWMRYSYALPVSGHQRAAAHSIYRAVWAVIQTAALYLYYILSCVMRKEAIDGKMLLTLLIPLAAVMLMQPVTDALKLRARSQDEMKKYNVTASAVPFFVYFSLMLVYMRKMVVLAAEMQAKAAEYEAANPYASGGYETEIFIDILTEKVTALRDLLIPWVIPVILVSIVLDYVVVRYTAERSDWS